MKRVTAALIFMFTLPTYVLSIHPSGVLECLLLFGSSLVMTLCLVRIAGD